VLVPVVRLDRPLTFLLVAPHQHVPAGGLVVEASPPALPDIRLVAVHLPVRQPFAPELETAVPLVRGQPHPELEDEVAVPPLGPQEVVAGEAPRFPDQRAFLRLPDRRIADPASQVLAVEERLLSREGGSDGHLAPRRPLGPPEEERAEALALHR